MKWWDNGGSIDSASSEQVMVYMVDVTRMTCWVSLAYYYYKWMCV